MFCPLAHISSTRPRQPRKLFSILIMLGAPAPPRGGPFIPKKSSAQWSCTPQSMIHPESQHAVQDAHTRAQSHARTDGQRRRQTAATPSPRSFIFSVENAACKDSYRCKCRRNSLLRPLPTLTSVRILTDIVLQREINACGLPVSECSYPCGPPAPGGSSLAPGTARRALSAPLRRTARCPRQSATRRTHRWRCRPSRSLPGCCRHCKWRPESR